MRDEPKRLPRPLVIVGGFLDPNITTPLGAEFFRSLTRDTSVISVAIGTCESFEDCRGAIIAAVDKACPGSDPQWTTEVDVVGFSLGGLAARYAAAPSRDADHPKRLKIARLFTISSPHTGAVLADQISLTQFHRDMRPGSEFLTYVAQNDARASYELYPYVHLNDEMVGADHAAPPGTNPLWLPNPPFAPAHFSAMMDGRILADIGRRLRGEAPLSHLPAPPLPG
jgi:pimeloyl-ACP methyl ester carboxylesterase